MGVQALQFIVCERIELMAVGKACFAFEAGIDGKISAKVSILVLVFRKCLYLCWKGMSSCLREYVSISSFGPKTNLLLEVFITRVEASIILFSINISISSLDKDQKSATPITSSFLFSPNITVFLWRSDEQYAILSVDKLSGLKFPKNTFFPFLCQISPSNPSTTIDSCLTLPYFPTFSVNLPTYSLPGLTSKYPKESTSTSQSLDLNTQTIISQAMVIGVTPCSLYLNPCFLQCSYILRAISHQQCCYLYLVCELGMCADWQGNDGAGKELCVGFVACVGEEVGELL